MMEKFKIRLDEILKCVKTNFKNSLMNWKLLPLKATKDQQLLLRFHIIKIVSIKVFHFYGSFSSTGSTTILFFQELLIGPNRIMIDTDYILLWLALTKVFLYQISMGIHSIA